MPPRAFEDDPRVVEGELGKPLDAVFGEFDADRRSPSASLAQVHRARLLDGREVAVKVQYPDIEHIVRTDLAASAARLPRSTSASTRSRCDFLPLLDELQTHLA